MANYIPNLNGYINLFNLSGVQYLTVNGIPSIVIPAAKNSIRVEKNERTGSLTANLSIKADAVGDQYRAKERENHANDPNWDESRLTSHQLIRTFPKDVREKIFEKMKNEMLTKYKWEELMPMMERVLRKDGSEGIPSIDNARAWEKLLWQELDRRSRIGRLSQNIDRTVTAQATTTVDAQEADYNAVPAFDDSDLPF